MNKITQRFGWFGATFVGWFLFAGVALAWTTPSFSPSGGNANPPIDASSNAQSKAGNFTAAGLAATTGVFTNLTASNAPTLSSLLTCTGGSALMTNSSGVMYCGAVTGSGGGLTTSGTPTANYHAKFTSATSIGNSIVSEWASGYGGGQLSVNGDTCTGNCSGGSLTLYGGNAYTGSGYGYGANFTVGGGSSNSSYGWGATININAGNSGTNYGYSGGKLTINGGGGNNFFNGYPVGGSLYVNGGMLQGCCGGGVSVVAGDSQYDGASITVGNGADVSWSREATITAGSAVSTYPKTIIKSGAYGKGGSISVGGDPSTGPGTISIGSGNYAAGYGFSSTILMQAINEGGLGRESGLVIKTCRGCNWGVNSQATLYLNANGNLYISGSLIANSAITPSDASLKKNIEPLIKEQGIAAIMQLKPVTFNWIDQTTATTTQFGFIAQDVQKIFPTLLHVNDNITDPGKKGTLALSYEGLIAPIVKAVQELATNVIGIVSPSAATPAPAALHASEQVCIDDQCLTKDDIRALLQAAHGR